MRLIPRFIRRWFRRKPERAVYVDPGPKEWAYLSDGLANGKSIEVYSTDKRIAVPVLRAGGFGQILYQRTDRKNLIGQTVFEYQGN